MRAAEDHSAADHAASLVSSQRSVTDLLNLQEDTTATVPPALLQQISRCRGEVLTREDLEDLSQNKYAIHAYTHGPLTGSCLSQTQ